MAQTVSALPPNQYGDRKHPWDTWLDGQIWLLDPEEDFDVSVASFRAQTITTASRRGLKVRTRVRPEGLYVQAYTPDDTITPGGSPEGTYTREAIEE
jgi:hypothetical protein